ncbi:MAG TPA: uroporphyrinogen decarboxylase family protein [Eggerthellaceae bacterium]|jgi:uroporphyrinogen decarboxylase|uniref:Methyltransferase n=1 Tax=Gordonibacter urolithinfaciens TaxID=1335613 RepID=A0A7K0I9W1_9ACTN|nr:uroporphyrinogen decarboxylase family protein [Gordonibacter urolithinfaciens]MCB6561150.1 uroporphyrinogen decarboxylase family protein [Gordonibacter urolithinfaciens]MCB7084405.1 uroporphyrinogen decarboxylase family protein [Gordonibacter urolithinfaciens]MSA94318.1 methyltransferase [Gordonibacter urolithinfaciens]HJH74379.1 uroporphyrinogen decarboxylase family protein [Eggerthellaceae bacterium]
MDMRKWFADVIASGSKQALPVLSFPAVQLMGITVRDLIGSSDYQAEAMRLIAQTYPTAASVSFMDLSVEAEAFGAETVVSDDEVPTVVGALVGEDTDPDDIAVPAVGAGRTGLYVEAIAKVAPLIGDRPVLAGAIGPFSLAGRLMDVSEVMVLCYEEPELVHAVLGKAARFVAAYADAFRAAGADGVVLAEPLAGLLSPDLAEEFSSAYVRRIVKEVQTDSFAVVYHNCGGGVPKMMDSIVATGAAAFHFGNAISMADVMPLVPADRVAMGNVAPAEQLRNGTPDSVRTATLEVLEACAGYPNFVVSTGCDVPPMAPLENIDAFFAAVDEFYAR